MKKLLIILTLTVLNTGIYAQKVFDEAVAKGMLERMAQDSFTFFNNETDPNFTMVFDNGTVNTAADIAKTLSNLNYKRNEISQKIRQVGKTAIVSGIVEESFFSKTDPNKLIFSDKEVFTYTYTLDKKKWVMVAGQHTAVPTPFTKETLNEILADYKTDSKAFFNSHLSQDFRYINNEGGFQPQKDFIGGTKQSIVTTEMLDPVIFQSGNLAVTSGLHKTVRTNSDGKLSTSLDGATYTWQNRNGKWMFVGSQQNIKVDDNDEQAIKNVLMKETASITARKADDFMSCYANKTDLMFGPYKNTIFQGYDAVKKEAESVVKNFPTPSPDTYDFNNWNIKINGNTSFTTYTQTTNRPSGNNSEFFKSDYLEKNNGEWKIVDHRYFNKPSSQDVEEAAIKNTIEGETKAGMAHDTDKEFSYWKQAPDASLVGGAQNKAYSFIGFDNIKKTATDMRKNLKVNLNALPVLKNTDYSITINGNSAFATYVQAQTSKGKTGKTRENRYLEKSNGEWKIVNVTFIVDGNAK